MTLAEHYIRGLYAGWRILWFDRSTIGFLETGGRSVLRSFMALGIAVPLYLLTIYLVGLDSNAPSMARAPAWLLLVSYMAGWPIFGFLMFHLSGFLGVGQKFSGFITLFNWWRIYALLLVLPVNILMAYGLVPALGADVLLIATTGLVIVYKIFLVRVVLTTNYFQTALIVSLDIILFLILEDSILIAFRPI